MLHMRFGETTLTRAAHTVWHMSVFEASDGRLEALHAGQTARTVMVRRLYFFSERVQRASRGQLPQSFVENLITMTSFFR